MDSAILTKVKIKYSYWLPVVLALKGIPVFVFYPCFDVFGLEANTGFCCFALFITGTGLVCVMPGRCSFVPCYCTSCAVAIGYNSYCFDGLNCS